MTATQRPAPIVPLILPGDEVGRPVIVLGPRRYALPAASESGWSSALSRLGPRGEWRIDGVLDELARPDLALHGVAEVMPVGGRLELTMRNAAFVDDALSLLDGVWPPAGTTRARRHFTAASLTELATACGLGVDAIDGDHSPPSDPARADEVFGPGGGDRRSRLTLQCTRIARGTLPIPDLYGEAVTYAGPPRRGSGTCHDHEVDLLTGRHRVVEVAPAAHTTEWLTDLGHSVTVVDRAVPSRARHHAAHVVVADLDVDDWSSSIAGRADAVLFGNVLEHVADPVSVLRSARHCLDDRSSDGVVVVSVPNVAHADVRIALAAGRWTVRDNGILDRTHLHHFTADALDQLADRAGYEVVERRATHVPRGSTINAEPGDDAIPAIWAETVDADPTATVHVMTVALAPRSE